MVVPQSLSGTRVRAIHRRAHEFSNRAGIPWPDGRMPNIVLLFCCGRRNPRRWKLSSNSAQPIKQENSVSRPLCPSDSQTQPSKGTQGNHGDKTSLAVGNTLRADQSHLSLACRGVRKVKLQIPAKRNRQVLPMIESTRRSEAHGSKPCNSIRVARKSEVRSSCAFALAFTTRVGGLK